MVEITFVNPSYLWVLVIVPFMSIIHFLTLRHSKSAVIKFSNFEAIQRVARGDVLGEPYKGLLRNKNIGLLLLRAVVYCLLILSVAGTTVVYNTNVSNFDYVLAIDASSSMLANDFSPTRFDAAREASMAFVSVVPPGANIGIVTFASTAITDLKPTSDSTEIQNLLYNIDVHQSGGTAIGDALVTSTNLFSTNKSKAIILITDGQNNVGTDPYTATDYAKKNGVVVHSIGLATKEGGNITNLNIVSKIDEGLLQDISQETGGKFFMVDSLVSLNDVFKEIATATKKPLALNVSWILLISAIVLLGIEWIMINTIYKTIP